MPKHKIAILINTLGGGGSERTVTHLLNGLRDEYECHLILFRNEIAYALPQGQVVKLLDENNRGRTSMLKLPLLARRLVKYCRENEIKLVFSFLHRPNFVASLAKKFGLDAKVLISERTYTPHYYRGDNLAGKIANQLIKWLYPYADAILPNSKGTMAALNEQYGVRNRYILVHNLVDIAEIDRKKAEAVDDYDTEKFTFINVGNFNYMKGQSLLVDAFASLGSSSAQLVFIGKGALLESVKEKAASLKIQDRVLFLGHKSNPFKYMARSDCFVFASEFEGFPNVLLEAMACGLPVISTDCMTGPRDLIAPETNGQTRVIDDIEMGQFGMLIPVGDNEAMSKAMAEMMRNTGLRNEYAASSGTATANYEIETVIKEYKQIIGEFLQLPQD